MISGKYFESCLLVIDKYRQAIKADVCILLSYFINSFKLIVLDKDVKQLSLFVASDASNNKFYI